MTPLPPDTEHLNLPDVLPGGEVEAIPGAGVADVVDGEVVEAPEPGPRVYVLRQAVQPVVQVTQTINVIVKHPTTRAAGRHASYILAGLVVLARRRKQRRTPGGRLGLAAEMAGDHANGLLWAKHAAEERQRRHERRKELPRVIGLWALVALTTLVIIGIALGAARKSWADVILPFVIPVHVVGDVASVIAVAWRPALISSPFTVLAFLYLAGRRGGDLAPKWAVTAAGAGVDLAIDEAAVSQALGALRIPQIRDYLKTGAPMPYLVGCRQEGRGTYCEVRLPKGLPASEISEKQQRRARLAAGLYRHTKEVWPSTGSDNSILKLWVADKGALEEGAGPYPLLAEGFTDVFKGLPFGKILKGDDSRITVMGRNTMCGGMPEQGKSTAAKVVACGYTLDVRTEVRIYVPDTNFDFERFTPRCSRYEMGAEDEVIERILGEMEVLKEELQSRGQLLIDAEQEEVTPALAEAGIGLHPVFVLMEEAHVVIQHRKFGKDFTQLLPEIVKLDRKRGVHLFVSTQAPTKDSMPRDVTRNCSNGIAFAVGDHVANDALLGQGAYRGGHRATELIPGADRGIALCKGFSGERSEMVQVHRIQGRAEQDDITPIVNRSLTEMARLKRAVPGAGRGPLAITYRDLVADLGEVTPESGKFRLTDLAHRLKRVDQSYYRGLDGVKLGKRLDDEGVRWTNPKNVPTLDTGDLRAVQAERAQGVS